MSNEDRVLIFVSGGIHLGFIEVQFPFCIVALSLRVIGITCV
jgi:hypothetical protein